MNEFTEQELMMYYDDQHELLEDHFPENEPELDPELDQSEAYADHQPDYDPEDQTDNPYD